MLRRKSYIHWYLSEGMDELEFVEAESHANDIICEYEGCENEVAEESGQEDLQPPDLD